MKKETQLANEIKKLQYQLSYSEHISINSSIVLDKELSQQLAFLYDKTGIPPAKIRQSNDIDVINTQVHLQELYYVEPMLMCYEESIYLLKNELDELKEESEALYEQVKKVVKENNFLRKELEVKIELLKKSETFGVNVNFLNLENKDLKEKTEILNSKNQYLNRKNKQLEDELNRSVKDQLGMFGENELKKIEKNAKEDLKIAESKNIELRGQIQILKNQLENQKSLVSQHERKMSQYESDLTKLRNQLRILKQQLQNHQIMHDGSQENLQAEIDGLKEGLKVSQRKQQQMFNKNMTLQSELQDKSNRVHNLNLQNSQFQANNNNMLQMLESYQVKVTNLNKKVKKMESQIKENREDGSEIRKKAEIAEWKLNEKVEEMERKEIQWKRQRNRLSQMWEERLEAMRKSYQNQLNAPVHG